ncbi:MAG: protein-L-isoaspartate O-methyltransferase [Azoarcus sp.]|jgi:protein-L-isoaspartate(D-aspartate) O-methyltransferase|nr:protein-L-isoaspartate O-methyltransferase [Azoarcus sp.]
MDFERARFNMVEQQIRPWDVTAPKVRQLLMTTQREDYVPPSLRGLAFADIEMPLSHGQTMLRPVIEGRILQALGMKRARSALEIGTGSGYFAALLASFSKKVYTVEIEPELAQLARGNFARNGIANVVVEEGDGAQGWFAQAPYDVIVVSGCLPELPGALLAQLKPGGRLFAFVGEAPTMKAHLIVRKSEKQTQCRDLFETQVPMLRHAPCTGEFLL